MSNGADRTPTERLAYLERELAALRLRATMSDNHHEEVRLACLHLKRENTRLISLVEALADRLGLDIVEMSQ